MDKRDNDEAVAPTSFLWGPYLPHRYFFEVISRYLNAERAACL